MQANQQWATRPADQRFETLDELRESVASRRSRSSAVDLGISDVHASVAPDGELIINSAIAPCQPTHWAFSQLAAQIGAPGGYLRSLPVELTATCLNHGLSKQREEGDGAVKFMTIAGRNKGLNTLQAVTSTKYGRIWDEDVVKLVQNLVDQSGGRFYNPKAYDIETGGTKPSGLYASDRDVFMFMIDGGSVLDVGPRAKLNRGFFVFNSEVGSRVFGLTTFLFNVVCGNHIVWGATDVNSLIIRHTKAGPTRFIAEATPTLNAYVQSSAKQEEATIAKAMRLAIPEKIDDLEDYVRPHKIGRAEVHNAVERANMEEGQCATLWDLVQGLTACAREYEHTDSRLDLERRAGALLDIVSV